MRISVVTPSFNQARFIERTIESVLAQRDDVELEYLVVDAGSTDGTLAILRHYEGQLRFVSEPDRGQSDALNKGFRLTSGEVLAWLNSDDVYEPGALAAAAGALRDGRARWCFGSCRIIDEEGHEIRGAITRYKRWVSRRYSRARLVGRNFIAQPAVFFRRDLLAEVGPIDEGLAFAMDYDLWLRFAAVAEPAILAQTLASFRWHGASKTGGGYVRGAWEAFRVARARARGAERLALVEHLAHYAAQVAAYAALDAFRR